MGHVIETAVSSDLRVEAVVVSSHPYLDIGTPENLLKAIRNVSGRYCRNRKWAALYFGLKIKEGDEILVRSTLARAQHSSLEPARCLG